MLHLLILLTFTASAALGDWHVRFELSSRTTRNEGMVMAYIEGNNSTDVFHGTVCDDRVDQNTADSICLTMGFNSAIRFGNIYSDSYSSAYGDEIVDYARRLEIVLDQLRCPDSNVSYNFMQRCQYQLRDHDCSYSENLVVTCETAPEPEPEPDHIIDRFKLYSFNSSGLTTDGPMGMVVVIGKDNFSYGTVCDDNVGPDEADAICRSMGYDGHMKKGNIYEFESLGDRMKSVSSRMNISIDQLSCPSNATNIEEDCTFDWFKHDCSHNEDLALYCVYDSNPAEYEIVDGGLFRTNESTGEVVKGSWGVVVLGIMSAQDDSYGTYGFVCSSVMTQKAADIACAALGFDAVDWWNTTGVYNEYLPEELSHLPVVMRDFYCPETADRIDDCSWTLMADDSSGCQSDRDAIIMRCKEKDPEPEPDHHIDHFELYSFNSSGGIATGGPMGMVVVIGKEDFGTVCDDNVGMVEADAICKSMGYDGHTQMGNIYDFANFGDRMKEFASEMNIAIDQLNCHNGTVNNIEEECTFDWFKHDCSHSEDLVLNCGEDTPDEYVISDAGIYRTMENDEIMAGSEGILVVAVKHINSSNDDWGQYGAVCARDNEMTDNAANIICKTLGFTSIDWWFPSRYEHESYLPEEVMENLPFVMSDFYCSDNAGDIRDCSYTLMDYNSGCRSDRDSIIMKCNEGDEPRPNPDDLDDEVEYKFGGLELKLNLSPKEGRAYVEDIIEEIADILG